MITKAVIQEVIDPYHIRVRIPLYNKIEGVNGATPNAELAIAAVCAMPNFLTDPKVGSIVIVGFEEDSISRPIVLGYLSNPSNNTSIVDIMCNNLTSIGETVLSADTTIGEVKPENIFCLKNLKQNINIEFQEIDKEFVLMKETDRSLQSSIDTNKKDIESINSSILKINTRIDDVENEIDDTKEELYKAIDNKIKVGITKPTTKDIAEGQVYLWIKDSATTIDN